MARANEGQGSLWELAVLCLLREGPMHPYQMQKLLRDRHKDEVLVLKRGSLYHAINRLRRAGLIAAVTVDRAGGRPERTTYRLTRAGAAELQRWLGSRLATPQEEPPELMGALSFLIHVTPREARLRLQSRARALQGQIRTREAAMKEVGQWLPRVHLVESEYLLAMQRAELAWVRGLVTRLTSRRLEWHLPKILREVRAAARKEDPR
jgi:DNA-binding PadR family transcriptional regulator